jgi:hypothetical protein
MFASIEFRIAEEKYKDIMNLSTTEKMAYYAYITRADTPRVAPSF